MKCKLALLFVLSLPLSAEEVTPDNWHFSGNIAYSNRALDGTIVNQTEDNNGQFGELFTTGNEMNVGTSSSTMVELAVQYKRYGVGLNYMPTSFNGEGTALVAASGDNAGFFVQSPLDSQIDVEMLLANFYYNIIQTPDTVFGVGLGLGQTSIDFNIKPELGNDLAYTGDQPFGFLNLHFSSNYNRFLYGFSLNGINAAFSGVDVDYSDYRVDLGYRVSDAEIKIDIIGGYRLINFALDIEDGEDKAATDISLSGPFLGITVTY
ncbi:hypothetical protein [Colwellia echini]|uniref:TIGR04219 family outer membrane beta-barrel protein n=1 Tax=Colwellia echini TaxID=1982103 RepID=A0ABY3N0U0_9GAMM|nr:hypothetical protein [Colwellia echini]TYK67085.1 hypothetical protein CWS31_000670 [Colwellia echini]